MAVPLAVERLRPGSHFQNLEVESFAVLHNRLAMVEAVPAGLVVVLPEKAPRVQGEFGAEGEQLGSQLAELPFPYLGPTDRYSWVEKPRHWSSLVVQ